jgi:hypothetical protein
MLRFGFAVAAWLSGHPDAGLVLDPLAPPGESWLLLHFVVVHALLLAALGVVAREYLAGARGVAPALVGFVVVSLPLVEAALALVPAVITLARGREGATRRSRRITAGFGLLALGHLLLVPLAAVESSVGAFHFVFASQLVAIVGALTLVAALPRGTP